VNSAELAHQFNLPNALGFEDVQGGLVRAVVKTPAAEAEIYLHGAHVTGWKPRGQRPVLFVSSKSSFSVGKAIRGGIPIIFPWFGPRTDGKSGPDHGFARTMEWALERTHLRDDGDVEITLGLAPNDSTRAFGYADFALRYRITVGSTLRLELVVHNCGNVPLVYEEALHTYFAVGDIRQVSISGLERTLFIDKTDGFKRKELGDETMQIARETDQVHLNTHANCVVHDRTWDRRIVVEKTGSDSTVIWNPWTEKANAMSDMGPGEWQNMICVESANAADNAVHLAAGASHKLSTLIRLDPFNDQGC
jgi:glucose-6-phosphate 1-epimerase